MNTTIEHVHDFKLVLGEAGPLSDNIHSIMQASDHAWSVGFADGTMVLAEWVDAPPRVAFSASIGAPPPRRRAAVHSVALSYNMLWRESGGVTIGQAGDDETMLLMQHLHIASFTAPDIARSLEHFARLAAWWGAYIESDDAFETIESRDFMAAMASRV